jgi:hypothetical protein
LEREIAGDRHRSWRPRIKKACPVYALTFIERGIEVCAPVHDAVLICAPLERLDTDVARMQDAMREASRVVLGGFELRTDAEVVRYPDRYADPRGTVMWDRVMNLIRQRMSGTENAAA